MSLLSSHELISTTHEFTDLCFDHVERKLGMSAIAMARDQDDIAFTTLLGLADAEYDTWKTHMQDIQSTTEEPTVSEEVMDAELEFTAQIFNTVGCVNKYSITNVQSGHIEIMRIIQSNDADLTHMTIAAQLQSDGSVELVKRKEMIILDPHTTTSEVLRITNEDCETFERLFHRLVAATETARITR